MNIGLINPNKKIKNPAIHLGLGYIASYALEVNNELNFSLLDTRVVKKREFNTFFNKKFDLVGITASSQTFQEAKECADLLIQKHPALPICIGGPHASTFFEETLLNYPFDFAVFGEGEVTFSELIGFLNGEMPITEINGLIYKNEKGKIIKNPPRNIIKDIDRIPFPSYALFKMNRYPQHRIITSRGCPYQCVFCNSHSIWTKKWRKRSAENTLKEIELLISAYSMKSFVFNDDSFNIDLERVEKICDYLISNVSGILWSASIRIDRINKNIAKKMHKAGCYNVSVGIESANNEVLKNIKKNISKEKISEGIQILRNAGIDVMGQFMIGNPGDTLKTIEESIEFAKKSNLNGVEFYTILPYKDTLIWEYANTYGKLLTDKPCFEYHTLNPRIIFETPEFSYEERVKAIELARKNGFYHALSTDRRNLILDIGRSIAKHIQMLFGGGLGNKMYLILRYIYRKYFRKGTHGK